MLYEPMCESMAAVSEAGSIILDATGQWVVLYDAGLRIQHANAAALRVLHRCYEDVVGKRWEDLGLPADVMRPLLENARNTFADGKTRTGELCWHLDTRERWFAYRLERVEIEGVHHVVSSKHETTESRLLARDMENYASVAAHDLRGPLLSIAMRAQLLRKQLDNSGLARQVDAIANTTRRLSGLVEDLLQYSKEGNIAPDLQPHDPVASIDHALEMLAPSLLAHRATIVVDVDAQVTADSGQLTRVWQNLIQNSVRYRSEEDLILEFSATQTDEWVRLRVQDNGIGFPPGTEDEAFRPFARLHGERSDGGAGLGLSVCARIVDAHGGAMRVVPRKAGACVEVTLHRANDATAPRTPGIGTRRPPVELGSGEGRHSSLASPGDRS